MKKFYTGMTLVGLALIVIGCAISTPAEAQSKSDALYQAQSKTQTYGTGGGTVSIVDIPYDGGDGRCPAAEGELVLAHDANGGCDIIDARGNVLWINHNNGRTGLQCDDSLYISHSLVWFYSRPPRTELDPPIPPPHYFESEEWLAENRCTPEHLEKAYSEVAAMLNAELE